MSQIQSIITGYEYLLEYFEDYDYRKPKFPKEQLSYRHPMNWVGHQQRTYIIFHCVEMYKKLGGKCLGLEPGAGQAPSPWCVSLDYYSGYNHPVYGGSYQPNVKAIGEVLPFKNNSFDFIVSHHSLEHMRDTEKTLREWLRVLKVGGKIVIVMPDKNYGPFGDPSHVSECTPWEFRNVLKRIENINIIEIDTLNNHFSFDAVIEKSNSTGDIMETQTIERINLKTQLRTLWQDRAMWTRMLIVSLVAELNDVNKIRKKLRKTQQDIGSAIGKYFRDENISKQQIQLLMNKSISSSQKLTPDEQKLITSYQAGNMLTVMLNHRILHIIDYTLAKKTGDVEHMNSAVGSYHDNNVSIASFLSSLNTSWNEQELLALLNRSENEKMRQIGARLDDDYDADFDSYEKAIEISLMIADVLADGIAKFTVNTVAKPQCGS